MTTTSPRPVDGSARLLRTCALAASSMTLAVAAHVAGGGQAPTPAGGLLLTCGVLAVAVGLTSVRLRLPVLLAVVGAGQWLLHEALTAMTARSGTGVGLTVHDHHGPLTLSTGAGHATAVTSVCGPSAGMLVCHVVASLLTAWLLARGEAALWRVVARLVPPRPGRRPRAGRSLNPSAAVVDHRPEGRVVRPLPARGPPSTRTVESRGTELDSSLPLRAAVLCAV